MVAPPPMMRWSGAHIGAGAKVVDLCAGLGGPARYLAHRYGAFVTGVELTPARVAGAAELTRRVGLDGQVQVIEGDVTALPLPDASQDAVVSQEALFHVPDLARALGEAHRVLRPGGRIAFTDWVAHEPLSVADKQLLWDGMAAATLITSDQHAELLRDAGFEVESIDDETDGWGIILAERLRMYQKLRGEAEQAGTPRRLLQILRAVRRSGATEDHGRREICGGQTEVIRLLRAWRQSDDLGSRNECNASRRGQNHRRPLEGHRQHLRALLSFLTEIAGPKRSLAFAWRIRGAIVHIGG